MATDNTPKIFAIIMNELSEGKITTEEAIKKAIGLGKNMGFRLGVDIQIGELSKKPIPRRDYSLDRLKIKEAIYHSIGAAMKDFVKIHQIKIPMRGSLRKRIAGNVFNVFERYKNFIEEEKLRKHR